MRTEWCHHEVIHWFEALVFWLLQSLLLELEVTVFRQQDRAGEKTHC